MYKLHLISKYLRKRRIAWVSLIAVMLCTAMVLVVISVMGGWLRMFRESFKGLSGDVLIEARYLTGFPYYQEMIDRIEKMPEVEAAIPILQSFGLLKIGAGDPQGVQVLGIPIERIGLVNAFPQSLYRQHGAMEEAKQRLATEKDLDPIERQELSQIASRPIEPPSFEPFLPPEVYESAVADPKMARYARNWPGMIVGIGVVGISKDKDGNFVNRNERMYSIPAMLTVMDMTAKRINADVARPTAYWIVDDSRTKVYQVDDSTVYVPFAQLQKDLRLDAHPVTDPDGKEVMVPGRTSQISIKLKAGTDSLLARDRIQQIVDEVNAAHGHVSLDAPDVWTWEQRPSTARFLTAVEKELVLVTLLFSLISVVAVFLIFCIFYMIVVEKTRDIGIVKSVGATSLGVAQIFLGYGLAIGILGSVLGFAAGALIVRNINELHTWMGKALNITMWDSDVYMFDTIPNTMETRHVVIIMTVAVIASVLGAIVPAVRAARMHPVEALRWE